jgi:hypothetical protein
MKRKKSSTVSSEHRSDSKNSDSMEAMEESKISHSKKSQLETTMPTAKGQKQTGGDKEKKQIKKTSKAKITKPNKSSVKSQSKKSKTQNPKIDEPKNHEIKNQNRQLNAVDEQFLQDPSHLPDGYGDHRLIFIARDPQWAFCFWEINSEKMEQRLKELGESTISDRWKLRVYIHQPGISENGDFVSDWDINLSSGKIYIELFSPGSTFIAELGIMDKQNNFCKVLTSNSIELPPDSPSENYEEVWTKGENIQEVFQEVFFNSSEKQIEKPGFFESKKLKHSFGESSSSHYKKLKK